MKPRCVVDAVHEAARRLEDAGVSFGHGTSDAMQEALWLAAHVLGLSWAEANASLDAPMGAGPARALRALVARRIATRKPAAYLLNEAWLGPHRFYIDERALVPRSFLFELMKGQDPFIQGRIKGPEPFILDLCTGSGCLAIVAALAFPGAKVDAADLSAEALEVAKRNVADYRLGRRIRLAESDLFANLAAKKYDLIISNPPYVNAAAMRKLPEEYRREPRMALASGADGLDHARVILAQARAHLKPGGLLVMEIGHNRKALEKSLPGMAFEWPKTSAGRGFVLAIARAGLPGERKPS